MTGITFATEGGQDAKEEEEVVSPVDADAATALQEKGRADGA